MTREQAISWLEKLRPQIGAETDEALTIVLNDSRLVQAAERTKVYYCDPISNQNCKKHGCHMKGGECWCTTNAEFAVWSGGQPLKAPMRLGKTWI